MIEPASGPLSSALSKSVLIPHGLGYNIYVRELGRAYAARGFEVAFGTSSLHSEKLRPALIHLQWPEEHYRWTGGGTPEALSEKFLQALRAWSSRGVKIAWTVHNIAPHEHVSSPLDRHVYQEVLSLASVVVHHCEVSRALLRERYAVPSGACEIVQPHGAYFGYPQRLDKVTARASLGVPPDAFVFLSFGRIRAYKGFDLLLDAYKRCDVRRKYLLVAGVYADQPRRGRIRLALIKRFARRVQLLLHEIPDDEVQPLVAACDAVVLSHRAGLNSGVAVLGMTFGRVVVGPRTGCIASVLEQGTNVLYDAGDVGALTHALEEASRLDLDAAERANVGVAKTWTWERIVDAVLQVSQDLSHVNTASHLDRCSF